MKKVTPPELGKENGPTGLAGPDISGTITAGGAGTMIDLVALEEEMGLCLFTVLSFLPCCWAAFLSERGSEEQKKKFTDQNRQANNSHPSLTEFNRPVMSCRGRDDRRRRKRRLCDQRYQTIYS